MVVGGCGRSAIELKAGEKRLREPSGMMSWGNGESEGESTGDEIGGGNGGMDKVILGTSV